MTNPLIAFALVAEEYEKSGDPIKGLAPLFRHILTAQAGRMFDAAAFARQFSEYYGLEMSEFVAHALRERMEEIGLLSRREGVQDQYTVAVSVATTNARQFDETKLSDTLEAFAKWAAREAVRLGRTVSREELDEALLSRLARPEFSSVFLDVGEKRDNKKIRELLGKETTRNSQATDPLFDYLVAAFVLAANEKAPDVFESLSSIAFGSLIADAVAGLADPGIREMPDPPLRVIVDGPLILDVIGLNDPSHHAYAIGLFKIMQDARLRLATFDHIVDEVRESIRSVVKAFQGGREYGPLGERLRLLKGFATYAISVADSLEDKLKELNVAVLRSDVYEGSDFKQYFTDAAFDNMRNAIGDVHFQMERRIRDTKSVAAVIRLKRRNRKPASVFQSGTTFLTRNSALFKKVNYVLSLGRSEPDPRFTIVTDAQLGGVLWFSLGSPSNGYSELSRRRLIANCATAIIPQREVVQRIAELLEQMDPSLKIEFVSLMRDKRASMCPMRLTGGLVDQVDNDSSMRILEAMREEIAAPLLEQAAANEELAVAERDELRQALNQSKDISSGLQEILGQEKESFDAQLAQLSLELDGQKAGRERTRTVMQEKKDSWQAKLAEKSSRLMQLRSNLVRGLKVLWTILSVVGIGATVFLDHIQSFWGLLVIFLLSVSSLTMLSHYIDALLGRVAALFYKPREREIESIKRTIGELEELLAVSF